jgi:fibronectin-binding autotransporter adhesin
VVASGGTASGTVVSVGGTEIVDTGGNDVGARISGGTETVSWVSNAIINGGTVVAGDRCRGRQRDRLCRRWHAGIFGTAMPSGTISGFVTGDTIDLVSIASSGDGTAFVTSGNVLNVMEGASTYLLQLDPSQNYTGAQFVLTSDGNGGVDVTVVNPVSVASGQTLTVSSGRTSGGVLVKSGGIINVLSGGTAIGTSVNKGGTARVSGRDLGVTLNGGLETVSRTGIASGTTINSGGSQTDLGVTVSTVVNSGAEIVSSGGTASSTVISAGASLTLLSRGLATGATVYSGGSETISKGGTDRGMLLSGGVQTDSGVASGTVILGGLQQVRSAGTAIGTVVSSGGTEIVSSRGGVLQRRPAAARLRCALEWRRFGLPFRSRDRRRRSRLQFRRQHGVVDAKDLRSHRQWRLDY